MSAAPNVDSTVSRRRFLTLGLMSGLGLAAGTLPLGGCAQGPYAPAGTALRLFSTKQYRVLEAACEAFLPDMPGMARIHDVELPRRIDALFADAAPGLRADLEQVLDTIEDFPLLSLTLTPFSRQSVLDRQTIMRGWEHSRFAIKRLGFQGLKKVACTVFYMQPEAWPEIGYPGPWIGQVDVGTGLDNQGQQPVLNPNVLAKFEA